MTTPNDINEAIGKLQEANDLIVQAIDSLLEVPEPPPPPPPPPPEPLVIEAKTSTGRGPQIDLEGIKHGTKVYTDRDYIFTAVPDLLTGHVYLRTAQQDARVLRVARYLVMNVSAPVTVYVLYDSGVPLNNLPQWLSASGWKALENKVELSYRHDPSRHVVARSFPAGEIVLGSNIPLKNGRWTDSNYSVVVAPATPAELAEF